MKHSLTTLLLLACTASLGIAGPPDAIAEFRGAPAEVRPMSTDRPDQTEGAFTVPKGWFQIEMGLGSYSQRTDSDFRDDSFAWGEINFKYGLTNDVDLQLIWIPYIQNRQDGGSEGDNASQSGLGDLVARVKYNIVGNDGGAFAMSVLPYVKIPTATHRVGNDMWEGGIYLNTEIDLGGGFALGNSVFASLGVDDDDEHYFRPGFTAVLGYDVTDRLNAYTEIFTAYQYDAERYWQTSLDVGVTYALTDNLMLDLSVFWFFRGDESIQPLVGVSWRF